MIKGVTLAIWPAWTENRRTVRKWLGSSWVA